MLGIGAVTFLTSERFTSAAFLGQFPNQPRPAAPFCSCLGNMQLIVDLSAQVYAQGARSFNHSPPPSQSFLGRETKGNKVAKLGRPRRSTKELSISGPDSACYHVKLHQNDAGVSLITKFAHQYVRKS